MICKFLCGASRLSLELLLRAVLPSLHTLPSENMRESGVISFGPVGHVLPFCLFCLSLAFFSFLG